MKKKARSCGECRACCSALGIHELNKAPAIACEYLVQIGQREKVGGNCGIYATRPESCRTFECMWLQGHFMGADRPDRTGVVFWMPEVQQIPGIEVFVGTEAAPGAAERGRGRELVSIINSNRACRAVIIPFGTTVAHVLVNDD